jgi:hypothetical protein
MLTQAVQWFNSCSTVVLVQKLSRDIIANQARANKAVAAALNTVAE